jgi:transcription initiation factor TFIIIB Brf1 subunit/transcription initiation factor TFIIB
MESTKSLLFPGAGSEPSKTLSIYDSYFKDEEEDLSTKKAYICPECETDEHIEQEKDEIICIKCNIHLQFIIDTGPETRWFGSDDRSPDPTRTGLPINHHFPVSGMATRMLWRSGDCKAMRRIRQFHLYSAMPSRERTLWNVFESLHIRTVNAGISMSILKEAEQIYSQIHHRRIKRTPQRDALLGASVFESLKRYGTARHPKEIAEMFSVPLSLFTWALKQLSELLEEHTHEQTEFKKDVPLTTSTIYSDFIDASLVRLDIPRTLVPAIQTAAVQIGLKVDEIGICPETTPPSLAATAVALACEQMNHAKSVASIAAALDISVATLSKCLKRCAPWKTVLFSREL